MKRICRGAQSERKEAPETGFTHTSINTEETVQTLQEGK